MSSEEIERNKARFGCYHIACGRRLTNAKTAANPWLERKMRGVAPSIEPVRHIVEGARAYASLRGLGDPHTGVDYHGIRQTADRVHQLSREYARLPMHDPAAVPHFEAMRQEVNHQIDHLTNRMGVRAEFVDHDPYKSAHEMANDLRNNRRIQVLRTASTGHHPFFSDEENDKFRAVHDAFGHASTGRDFDGHGEEAAFNAHARMFSHQARGAMATETRGQNGYVIHHDQFGPQKIAVMHHDLWTPEGMHHQSRKLPRQQKCKYCSQQATQRVIHSEGMAYIPTCDDHLGNAKDDAATCTPDGSRDESNIDAVRKIAVDWEEFRLLDHAQENRYERAGIGGSKEDRDRYFGTGEQMGQGVERRANPRDWIKHSREPRLEDTEPEFQENWRGFQLGHGHGKAGRVDHEELEHVLKSSPHPEELMDGYEEGLRHAFGEDKPQGRIATLLDDSGSPTEFFCKIAHVSGNQIDVLHCPFCGSGAIVARSDGSINCTFCNAAFTVTVAPLYSAFPQSVGGDTYPWPGRPDGGVDPSMMQMGDQPGGGFGGGLVPGGGEEDNPFADGATEDGGDGDDDSNPFAKGGDDDDSGGDDKEAEVGGKKKPPFGKKSSAYRTVFGGEVDTDAYIKHLALQTARDPNTMAERMRSGRV